MSKTPTDLRIKDIPEIIAKVNKVEEVIENVKEGLDDLLDFVVERIKDNSTNDKDLGDAINEVNWSFDDAHRSLDKIIHNLNSVFDCKI